MNPPVDAPRSAQTFPSDVDAEVLDGAGELHPAAPDPGVLRLVDRDPGIASDGSAGLIDPGALDADASRHDERLRARAGRREPPFHEGEIEADLLRRGHAGFERVESVDHRTQRAARARRPRESSGRARRSPRGAGRTARAGSPARRARRTRRGSRSGGSRTRRDRVARNAPDRGAEAARRESLPPPS